MNSKYLSIFFLLVTGAIVTSCDGDDEATADDLLKSRLYKNWTLTGAGYVKYNGVDITDQYTALLYTFNADGSYQKTVNNDQSTGTWTAADNTFTTLTLDGGVPLYVLELTKTTFRFSLIIDEGHFSSGRGKGLSGEYEFFLHVAQ